MNIINKTSLIIIFLLSFPVFSQDGESVKKVKTEPEIINLEQVEVGQKSIMRMVLEGTSILKEDLSADGESVQGLETCLGATWKDYMSSLTKYAQKQVDSPSRADEAIKFLRKYMQKRDEELKACFGVLKGGDAMFNIYQKKVLAPSHPVTLTIRQSRSQDKLQLTRDRKPVVNEKKKEKKKWWQRN